MRESWCEVLCRFARTKRFYRGESVLDANTEGGDVARQSLQYCVSFRSKRLPLDFTFFADGNGPVRLDLHDAIAFALRRFDDPADLSLGACRTLGHLGPKLTDRSMVGHAASRSREGRAAKASDTAASLARLRLTMSVQIPSGVLIRHMPGHLASGSIFASSRPECSRSRLPRQRKSWRQ